MLALLTLPRGAPVEPALELVDTAPEEPAGACEAAAWEDDGMENGDCSVSGEVTEEQRRHRLP